MDSKRCYSLISNIYAWYQAPTLRPKKPPKYFASQKWADWIILQRGVEVDDEPTAQVVSIRRRPAVIVVKTRQDVVDQADLLVDLIMIVLMYME